MEERPPTTANQSCDVAIIGGGASGLAAALAAAREGAHVCVIERDVEAGLSILATGNGRCNLSNARLDPTRYRHPEAFRQIAGETPEKEVQTFFDSIGLMIVEEDGGRLYPRTRRAESVRDVLLHSCDREGVELRCCCLPEAARHIETDDVWDLTIREPAEPFRFMRGRNDRATLRNERRALQATEMVERHIRTRAVIIACGGACKEAAELFNLPHLPETPVLCPIACTTHDLDLAELDGLRVEAGLMLERGDTVIAYEKGEVLFRPYGISGIAAFNLSRRCEPGDAIELDLFPELTENALVESFCTREQRIGALTDAGAPWFDGLLAPALGRQIFTDARIDAGDVSTAASCCKHLDLTVTGATETERAQLRHGGIPLDTLDLPTLTVRPSIAPALHVCGEAIDMDADCGGYNLAWAWLSGLRAGTTAGTHINEKDHA